MQKGFWCTTDWGKVWVHRYGVGPRLLLAQHGFGRDGRRFRELGEALGNHFTLLAPDLPFHGRTAWTASYYDPARWQSSLQTIVESTEHTHFYYLGHSLGGRIGLKLFSQLAPQLAGFCLVAPDGLAGPYTHWIDRLPTVVVRGLSRTLTYHRGLLTLARRLYRWRLIDSLAHQYLQYQLQDEVFRERLRGTLRSVIGFRLAPDRVIDTLRQADAETSIFLGRHDRLVDVQHISRLFAAVDNVRVNLANHGHELPFAQLRDHYLRQVFR